MTSSQEKPISTMDDLQRDLEAIRAEMREEDDALCALTARREPAEIRCPACQQLTRRSLLMTSARGTACPACYDRMSE